MFCCRTVLCLFLWKRDKLWSVMMYLRIRCAYSIRENTSWSIWKGRWSRSGIYKDISLIGKGRERRVLLTDRGIMWSQGYLFVQSLVTQGISTVDLNCFSSHSLLQGTLRNVILWGCFLWISQRDSCALHSPTILRGRKRQLKYCRTDRSL